MHALNGNIDHPQQIDINAIPVKRFLPVIVEKIVAPRAPAPAPSSTAIPDFEKELARTNPASAASLQRDVIDPHKKSKKKKNKDKLTPPLTNANATVVHFNMNLQGVQSAIHFQLCRRNRFRIVARRRFCRRIESDLENEKDEKK